MLISEISAALTSHYRKYKKANGGHKTSPKGKYGFNSIRYKVVEADGTSHGPFLGRGSALTSFRKEVKLVGRSVEGVKFVVEEFFKPKAKDKEIEVKNAVEFVVTTKPKTEQEEKIG
jgi:hypothetical protein